MTEKKEQKPRIEVMLDMETCGIAETSAIMEVALVPFMLDGSKVDEGMVNHIIDLTSCFMAGMTQEPKTQEWWGKDPHKAKARARLMKADKVSITSSIDQIYDWLQALGSKYEVHLWDRGLNFDLPKLDRCFRELLELEEMPYPWWLVEDARTYCHAFDVHSEDVEFAGTPHAAIDDCRHQIKLVQRAYEVRSHLLDCKKIVETAD